MLFVFLINVLYIQSSIYVNSMKASLGSNEVQNSGFMVPVKMPGLIRKLMNNFS